MFKIIKIRAGELAQGLKEYDCRKITIDGRADGAEIEELNKEMSIQCDEFTDNAAEA